MKKKWQDHALGKTFPGAVKILLKMKLTLCIILISFLGALASESYSQTTKLSLDLKNVKVKDALGAIEVVPNTGFDVENAAVTAGLTGIHVACDALGIGPEIDTGIEKYIVAEGIVVLQTPNQANIPALKVITFKTIQHNLDLINAVDLTSTFNAANLKTYNSYTNRKVYGCLLTLDDLGNPIKFSSTLSS